MDVCSKHDVELMKTWNIYIYGEHILWECHFYMRMVRMNINHHIQIDDSD